MLTPAEMTEIRENRRVLGRHSHRPLKDQDDVHLTGVADDFGTPIPSLACAVEHRALAMLQRAAAHRAAKE